MRLFIIRHAEPDYPNNTITPAGHLEAQALARRLAKLGLDRIYSSPMGRAMHTMQYTAHALKITHTIEEWTQELSDASVELPGWGKMATWDVPGEVIHDCDPRVPHNDWHARDCFNAPGLQRTIEKINRNSDAFLERHGYRREGGRYRILKSTREKIAVFCHNGFGLCWFAHLLNLPLPLVWSGFTMSPTAVTTILFDERSKDRAVPRCIGFGDTSHLYEAGLSISPAGIKANVD